VSIRSRFWTDEGIDLLGSLAEDIQSAFVSELGRGGRDLIYWVRREASFALGALAKVVPVEVLLLSLVGSISLFFFTR